MIATREKKLILDTGKFYAPSVRYGGTVHFKSECGLTKRVKFTGGTPFQDAELEIPAEKMVAKGVIVQSGEYFFNVDDDGPYVIHVEQTGVGDVRFCISAAGKLRVVEWIQSLEDIKFENKESLEIKLVLGFESTAPTKGVSKRNQLNPVANQCGGTDEADLIIEPPKP